MGLTQFETIYDAGILRASKTIAREADLPDAYRLPAPK
jgi:hypothetical protein